MGLSHSRPGLTWLDLDTYGFQDDEDASTSVALSTNVNSTQSSMSLPSPLTHICAISQLS